jgi:hypothetical protein
VRADLAYAARALRRAPGYVAVAVATLALGIGANTAIFSLVNGVLLRPLPWPDPDRVVRIFGTTAQDARDSHAGPDFLDLRERLRTFSVVAAWTPARFTLLDGRGPQGVDGAWVSDGFFVLPAEGRFFHDGDARRGAGRVAVLSYATWRERFSADPRTVGSVVTLNREPVTIVGVARPDFVAPERHDIWVLDGDLPPPPFGAEQGAERDREMRYLLLIGRIHPDVAREAVNDDLKRVARHLAAAYPAYHAQRGLRAVPLGEVMTAEVRPGLLMLSGAVGFLLLIACANVANLALARATARER